MGFVYFQLCRCSCFLRISLYVKGTGEQKQQSMKMLKQMVGKSIPWIFSVHVEVKRVKEGKKNIKAYMCQWEKGCRLRCVCRTAWWSLAACWAGVRGGSVIISPTAASLCFSDPVACGVVHPAPEVVSSSAACKPTSCNRVSWSSWVVTFCWCNAARQGCGSVAGVKQNAVHQTFMRHFARGCILKE